MSERAFLFGWNPIKWPWADLGNDIEKLNRDGYLKETWSAASHKAIKPGDKAYVVRLGAEPKGIFASGIISSEPFLAVSAGRTYYRVVVKLDVLLNPKEEPILTLDLLKTGNLAEQMWTPQASGVSVRPHLVEELEGLWLSFLDKSNRYKDF